MQKELGIRGIRDNQSLTNANTEDEAVYYPLCYTIPKPSYAYTFYSKSAIYKYLVSYTRHYRVIQSRNGSRKYNYSYNYHRAALIYVYRDTKKTKRYRKIIALFRFRYIYQIRTIRLSRRSQLVRRQSITIVASILQACYSIVRGNKVSASVRPSYTIRGIEYYLPLYVQY